MPEIVNSKQIFTLREVGLSIKKTLDSRYGSEFWVKAEINKLNYYPHSGHCYPDLVEKKEGKIVAQFRSTLWKDIYRKTNDDFISILKEPLKDGIKVLVLARVSFDPSYGLSLNILDIDPSYTLGDLAMEKQETIARLMHEELFHANRSTKFPLLPQNIAIISVESSKGYADFMGVLHSNPWSYRFHTELFPALLQGDNAVSSINKQLSQIRAISEKFDVVAIIRGGGGDVGLSCYNNYLLAKEIADFPLPVITGIGHATNETVAEMVSYYNAITPTKLADYLIQHFHNMSVPVLEAERILNQQPIHQISMEKERLLEMVRKFLKSVELELTRNQSNLKAIGVQLQNSSAALISGERSRNREYQTRLHVHATGILKEASNELISCERVVHSLDPVNVLKRGFSITSIAGKIVKGSTELNKGDRIITQLFQGKVESLVNSIDKGNEE